MKKKAKIEVEIDVFNRLCGMCGWILTVDGKTKSECRFFNIKLECDTIGIFRCKQCLKNFK